MAKYALLRCNSNTFSSNLLKYFTGRRAPFFLNLPQWLSSMQCVCLPPDPVVLERCFEGGVCVPSANCSSSSRDGKCDFESEYADYYAASDALTSVTGPYAATAAAVDEEPSELPYRPAANDNGDDEDGDIAAEVLGTRTGSGEGDTCAFAIPIRTGADAGASAGAGASDVVARAKARMDDEYMSSTGVLNVPTTSSSPSI